MNKLFKSIVAASVGVAMAIGVGAGLSREANAVYSATTYEQLTSIASIDESAQYVLGIDGTGFHYEGTSSWGKTALPSAQTPIYYTLAKAQDGNSFTAKATISGTTYFLQVPTSNTFSMATSAGTNTDLIIGTTQVSGTNYAVANKTTTTRHLRINGTSGLRSYAGTTGSMAFFYKVVSDGEKYTVTYDSNGATSGAVPTDGTQYANGATVTVLGNTGNLAKSGCTFDGWNTKANGLGTNYDEDDTFSISSNITLYAQWDDGSLVSNLTFTAKCNGSGTANDNAKWIVSSDGTESTFDSAKGIHYGTNNNAVQYIELSSNSFSGVTVSRVVVNASVGSGVSATVGVTIGGSAFGGGAQSLAESADDYVFTGEASGNIVVTITKPSSAIKALYCKSVIVTYSGTIVPKDDVELSCDDLELDVSDDPTALNVVATSGGNTVTGLTYTYQIGKTSVATVSNVGVVTPVAIGGTTLTITFAGDNNYNPTTKTIAVVVFDETFLDTEFDITPVADIALPDSGDTTEKYYVIAKVTAITYASSGSGRAIDQNGTNFDIYYMYNYDGTVAYSSMSTDQKPVAGDIVVLYGVFTKYSGRPEIKNAWVVQRNGVVFEDAAEWTVTFVTNSDSVISPSTVSDGESIDEPTAPTKTDYVFGGWYTDEDCTDGNEYNFSSAVTSDLTLYAKWVAKVSLENTGLFVKVTSDSELKPGSDYKYLISYDDGSLVFDGSLQTLDASGNSVAVSLGSGIANVKAAFFTITEDSDNDGEYNIKSASGNYIGRTADSNGLNSSTSTKYSNSISFEDGNVEITSSAGAVLRYNKTAGDVRFRYYKSTTYTGQQSIQLYRILSANELLSPSPIKTIRGSVTVENGQITTANSISLRFGVKIASDKWDAIKAVGCNISEYGIKMFLTNDANTESTVAGRGNNVASVSASATPYKDGQGNYNLMAAVNIPDDEADWPDHFSYDSYFCVRPYVIIDGETYWLLENDMHESVKTLAANNDGTNLSKAALDFLAA